MKSRFFSRWAAVLLALLMAVAASPAVLADDETGGDEDAKATIQDLNEQLSDLQKQKEEVEKMISQTQSQKAQELATKLIESGLLILTAGPGLRFLPPLTITKEEIDKGLAVLKATLADA